MIGKIMSVISQTDVEAYVKDEVLLTKSQHTRYEVSDLREGIDLNISNHSSRAQVASDENDPGGVPWRFLKLAGKHSLPKGNFRE